MAKQNRQPGANPAQQQQQNAATEFASETNVSDVRQKNQQSANKAAQQQQPGQQPTQ